jgi:hypothetical protein
MALKGRSDSLIRAHPNGRNRRILLLPAHPGEGRFTQPTAAVQTWRRELVFMPLKKPCRRAPDTADLVKRFGCRPVMTYLRALRAGVRKPPRKERSSFATIPARRRSSCPLLSKRTQCRASSFLADLLRATGPVPAWPKRRAREGQGFASDRNCVLAPRPPRLASAV